MKHIWSIIVGIVLLVAVVFFVFTARAAREQRLSLVSDLEYRTKILAESFSESVEPVFLANAQSSLQKILDRFANRRRLLGLAVYDNQGQTVASSEGLAPEIIGQTDEVSQSMDADKAQGFFSANAAGTEVYRFIFPLHQDKSVVGALVVVQQADFIDATVAQTWRNNILWILIQTIVVALAIIMILKWLIFRPMYRIIDSLKSARLGRPGHGDGGLSNIPLFKPLAHEVARLSTSLFQARSVASEEARLRFQKLDTPWTEERLKEFIKSYLKDRKLFVVSNREPYIHSLVKNKIIYSVPASGMVTAIEATMDACGGLWLAQATGNADKQTSDAAGKILVPPDEPKYTLKRVWLSEKEKKGFYIGFANEALWPLCHMAHTRPIFREQDWQEYRRVNGKFAQSLLAEIKNIPQPLILVQDFHFALLPAMIKKARPDAQIGLFWHVPWPSAEAFSICPWRKEILEGMLGADVVGFHIQQYCNNFMETVGKEIESLVDLEQFTVTRNNHSSYIKPYPISIPLTNDEEIANQPDAGKNLLERFNIKTEYLGLGVDRLDYAKGILERLKGIEFFFNLYPKYKEKFTFLQIAPPSREEVEKYRQFNVDVTSEAERINKKFAVNGWKPIVLIKENLSHQELYPLYRQANVCIVSSLHDGMNLVSKEFVAARNDEAGVLILSPFAGAARELKSALIVNPYSAEQMANAVHEALNMPLAQQYQRMKKMRNTIKNYNIYRWSAEFIRTVAGLG